MPDYIAASWQSQKFEVKFTGLVPFSPHLKINHHKTYYLCHEHLKIKWERRGGRREVREERREKRASDREEVGEER